MAPPRRRQRRVGNDQAVVDSDDAAEAAAGLAGADGRIEAESARGWGPCSRCRNPAQCSCRSRNATGAADLPARPRVLRIDIETPLTDLERRFDCIGGARRVDRGPAEAILDHLQRTPRALFVDPGVALSGQQPLDFRFGEILRDGHRKSQQQVWDRRERAPTRPSAPGRWPRVAPHGLFRNPGNAAPRRARTATSNDH